MGGGISTAGMRGGASTRAGGVPAPAAAPVPDHETCDRHRWWYGSGVGGSGIVAGGAARENDGSGGGAVCGVEAREHGETEGGVAHDGGNIIPAISDSVVSHTRRYC